MALNNEFKVKNDLNTLGRILSGGVDIRTIFSPSNTSWTLSANNGTFGVAGGDTLQVQGGNGVDVRVATGTDTVRISGIDATTSVKGVASFNSASFAVTNGDVTIKSSGVSNAQLSGSITDDKLSVISATGKVSNSATTATSSNTANAIVARGASGEFSSGSITATGNLSASGTVTGNAVVASNITATNLLSAANTFTRQLSVGNVQVKTVGTSNVFLGDSTTGRDATTGDNNLVFGVNSAGGALTSGSNNNFLGSAAGQSNTTGRSNNFFGISSGFSNSTGSYNNFLGNSAGSVNSSGNFNNFFGRSAGSTNTIGSNNTIIGNAANVSTNSLSGVIVLGTGAIATESHQVVLSTANVLFRSTGSTFEIGSPSLTNNLTVFGAVSSTGIVNTNTGFRISNAATSGNVLRGNGTNFVSSTLAASDIASGQALTKTDDTNVTLTLGGTPSAALLQAANLTLGWTGLLAGSRGGTNNGFTEFTGPASTLKTFTLPNASATILTTNAAVTVLQGGTGATTAQGAINTLAGAVTSGQFLRGNGTNVVLTGIQVSDVPTLNQNTTGSAATLATTQTLWGQAFNGSQTVSGNLTSVGNITGSGAITIQPFATNQDISLTTSGTGEVNIAKVDIDSGTIDGVTIGGTVAVISVSSALLDVDNIRIDGNTVSSTNTNGNITLAPNGTGSVLLDTDTVRVGDFNTPVTITTNGTGALTLNTNSSTNSGFISIAPGVNGNINLTPNGTGSVVISRAAISAGTINNTTIGLTTPASGVFTGVTVRGDVTIDGSLYISGSAARIDTTNLIVSDPIIFLGEGNLSDSVDIGFTAAYNHGATPPRHTGLIRDHVTKEWTLFKNLSAEILSAVDIPLSDPSLQIDTLNANINGTLNGNVSGTALRANQFTTARIISATGDISYSSGSFDGSTNVTGTATINNNAVTYAKFQQVAANSVVGNPTGSTANAQAIPASVTGFALLSATNPAAAATTIGLGTTNSVTFGEVIVNNGTKSVVNDVYNNSGTNAITLSTFANASYNSAKFTVQIKNTTTSARCALEIIATKNISTWEGTVYGIVDPANLFTDVNITAGPTVELAFTLVGATNHTITAYAQAISD